MESNQPQVNFIIPLYNEESVFNELVSRLVKVIEASNLSITVIMVDDGSVDQTPFLMQQQSLEDSRFTSIFLSKNFGHQKALTAGIANFDATEGVFILDGDLQDPPELIDQFYERLSEGYDVVYAIREKRKENVFKQTAYKLFYKLLKRISYIDMPLDSGDFSLISRRVAEQMNRMPEESRFLRGIRGWIGFSQIGVKYKRSERSFGAPKYTFKKLLQLALNGIFNFSEFPIKFIINLGITTFIIGLFYFGFTMFKKFAYGAVPEGFTALLFMIILFGGVQLIAIGVVGEYLLRIFFQVKQRPLFIIKSMIKDQKYKNG